MIRMGSNRELGVGFNGVRCFGIVLDEEKVKAVLCIFEVES